VKRTAIFGFISAMAIATVLVAPSAQAATARAPSTVCSFVMNAKFHDGGLVNGENSHAFFTFDVTLSGCAGSKVTSATGTGGSAGDLFCSDGALQGLSSAKMQVFWDTGGNSGINFHFDFTRSRYGGKILAGHFRGQRVRARDFPFTATKGDCDSSPLVRAQISGNVSL
jgi:hypothetical protein